MPSVNTSMEDLESVVRVLKTLSRRESIDIKPPVISAGEVVISPKEALSLPTGQPPYRFC